MIFIVGYTFTIGRSSPPPAGRGGSVLQQLNENKMKVKIEPDSPLVMGSTYRLGRIKPVISDKKVSSYEYQFVETSTGAIRSIVFFSTQEADTYIARVSGKFEEYKQQKERAKTITADI